MKIKPKLLQFHEEMDESFTWAMFLNMTDVKVSLLQSYFLTPFTRPGQRGHVAPLHWCDGGFKVAKALSSQCR